MNTLTRLFELVSRINPFSIDTVVLGQRVEINRRIHRLMYGTERD